MGKESEMINVTDQMRFFLGFIFGILFFIGYIMLLYGVDKIYKEYKEKQFKRWMAKYGKQKSDKRVSKN